jgi:hypothetical protein
VLVGEHVLGDELLEAREDALAAVATEEKVGAVNFEKAAIVERASGDVKDSGNLAAAQFGKDVGVMIVEPVIEREDETAREGTILVERVNKFVARDPVMIAAELVELSAELRDVEVTEMRVSGIVRAHVMVHEGAHVRN